MDDRNKTQLTHDVTRAVVRWLDERGFKPVETEVPLCCGWCADVAGVIVPTQTELINLKLLSRRPGWKSAELPEWNAAYEALDRVMTCLVEVKTSRGDFLGDKKWNLPLPTDLAFLAVPRGLTDPQEWPAGWGVLEFHEEAIRRLRVPTPTVVTLAQQRDVILQIAIRRDHHTRYERWRETARRQRVQQAEEKTRHRTMDITRALLDVAHGRYESATSAMEYSGIRNIHPAVMERIEKLWNIARQDGNA